MGTPIEGFFDEADIVVEAMASAFAVAQGALTKTPIPSPRLGPVEESTQTKRVGESVPTLAEIPTPQKGVTLAGASQTRSASPATPFIISASDPLVTLSHAMKYGTSLVVTPSSIPRSATHGTTTYLSFDKGSKETIEDSKDELVMRKRVFYSNKDGEHEIEAMGMCFLSLKDLFFSFYHFLVLNSNCSVPQFS